MDTPTFAPTNPNSFDIQTGMAVYASDDTKIGTVMEIVGFGATKVSQAGADGNPELVTEAKTGSGYFNMNRSQIEGGTATPLTVPFRGIKAVVAGHGVTLNDTIIDELSHQRDPRPPKKLIPATKRRKLLPRWL